MRRHSKKEEEAYHSLAHVKADPTAYLPELISPLSRLQVFTNIDAIAVVGDVGKRWTDGMIDGVFNKLLKDGVIVKTGAEVRISTRALFKDLAFRLCEPFEHRQLEKGAKETQEHFDQRLADQKRRIESRKALGGEYLPVAPTVKGTTVRTQFAWAGPAQRLQALARSILWAWTGKDHGQLPDSAVLFLTGMDRWSEAVYPAEQRELDVDPPEEDSLKDDEEESDGGWEPTETQIKFLCHADMTTQRAQLMSQFELVQPFLILSQWNGDFSQAAELKERTGKFNDFEESMIRTYVRTHLPRFRQTFLKVVEA